MWYFSVIKCKEVFGTKLQIVDSSEVFCSALKDQLPDTFEIEVCLDGETAVSKICAFCPDILVLSAALSGNDGFYILQTVQNLGVRPMVLMFTPLISDYVVELAADLKVDYVMCKPCNMRAVIACIDNFRDKISGEKDPVQISVRNYLLDMGFRTNLCGYRYLMSALCALWENPGQSLTKELYPVIAKQHNGSWQQIEHGIRLSIADAWKHRTGGTWKRYFPDDNTKPTNSVFLTRMAEHLHRVEE